MWYSDQAVTCIWHRQTDSMMWWPQYLKDCNRKLKAIVTYPSCDLSCRSTLASL